MSVNEFEVGRDPLTASGRLVSSSVVIVFNGSSYVHSLVVLVVLVEGVLEPWRMSCYINIVAFVSSCKKFRNGGLHTC